MNNDIGKIEAALAVCVDCGVEFDTDYVSKALQTYIALIQEWNRYASLVSEGDAATHLAEHCVDSISLAPYLKSFLERGDGEYIDLGTGGGFPAIPLRILFPELNVTLIERNMKKTVFLKKVIGKLSLVNVSIKNESFEGEISSRQPRVVTARAIEKPAMVIPEILSTLRPGDCFLCQSEAVKEIDATRLRVFNVRELSDDFSASCMRRNQLYQIELLT